MSGLPWLGVIAAVLAAEVAVGALMAGRRRRGDVSLASLFGNLTFEALFAISDATGGVWPAIGFVVMLGGELAALVGLGRVRPLHALAIVLLANLVGTMVLLSVAG